MKKILLALAMISLSFSSFSQGREFIRTEIEKNGECRNVAITESNGDLMLYGLNGWAASECPTTLIEALNALTEADAFIDDVQLTEQGRWLILHDENGIMWNDIPQTLEATLREFNSAQEIITSVTFNDSGDWIIISQNQISASDDNILQWLSEGLNAYGQLWAACVTETSLVAVYEKGFTFLGDVPEDMKKELGNIDFDVYRIKIAGPCWFISDGESKFSYKM